MRTLRSLALTVGYLLLFALAAAVHATPLDAMPDTHAYCTASDVEDQYNAATLAELTGDASGEAIDAGIVTQAIESYGGIMRGYVLGRYPDVTDDPTLRSLNVEGAYLTLCRRRYGGLSDGEIGQMKMLRQQLVDLSNGVVTLETDAAEGETPALDVESLFVSNPRLYGRDKITGRPRG